MNEDFTKAAQTADLLCQDLRELHRRFCKDALTLTDMMVEAYALGLLNQAVAIKRELEGVRP
jgi:hypothetical protein